MKKLSIFVDESGDFGEYDKRTESYIVSLVFHNQKDKINNFISHFYRTTNFYNTNGAIHTEPLIRKEKPYGLLNHNERRSILTKLYFFALKLPIQYKTFVFNKKDLKTACKLEKQIYNQINNFFITNAKYFRAFDSLTLYYDNGQLVLFRILKQLVSNNFQTFEIRKVLPINYLLFQVADMICALMLVYEKTKNLKLSKSELYMFYSSKKFKKDFIKKLFKKEFDSYCKK